MRILIVEDEFNSRKILQQILSPYGEYDICIDGEEAIEAFMLSWLDKKPYDLICMDIMMPKVDGLQALEKIRELENEMGVTGSDQVKVIMVSAVDNPKTVFKAFLEGGATSYIVKPIDKSRLIGEIGSFGLIKEE